MIKNSFLTIVTSFFLILTIRLLFSQALVSNEWSDLERQLDDIREAHEVVGLAAALVSRDGVLWLGASGLADLETGRPATVDTPFRVGSISKTVTALALLKLEEAGLLDLHQPLLEVAPASVFMNPWQSKSPVKLIHLLEHTAGLDDFPYYDGATTVPNASVSDYAIRARPPRKVWWEPGRFFRYSSVGTGLAGYAVEVTSGVDFDTYVTNEFFKPIGMESSSFRSDAATAASLSRSYYPGSDAPAPYWHLPMRPAGSMHASVRDMAKFLRFLLSDGSLADGTSLLSASSIKRLGAMESSDAGRLGIKHGNGLGAFHFLIDGHFFLGHWGSVDGFRAAYGINRDADMGMVLLLNTGSDSARWKMLNFLGEVITSSLPQLNESPAVEGALSDFHDAGGWYVDVTPQRQKARWLLHLMKPRRLEIVSDEAKLTDGWKSNPQTLYGAGPGLLRPDGSPEPIFALHREPSGTVLFLDGGAAWRQTAAWRFWMLPTTLGLAAAGALVAIFCGTIGWTLSRSDKWIATLPVASAFTLALLLLMTVKVGFLGGTETIHLAGRPGLWTATIWLLSFAYPVLALFSLWTGWFDTKKEKIIRWLLIFSAVLLLPFAGLLASEGWIGLLFWRA